MAIYVGGTGTANKLDDYEEGSWTPVLKDAASGGNTYSGGGNWTTWANYTKIGNTVRVHLNAYALSSTGMNSAQIFIHGMPFVANGSTTSFVVMQYFDSVDNTQFGTYTQINNGNSHCQLLKMDDNANGNPAFQWNHIKTNGYFGFQFNIMYNTNS